LEDKMNFFKALIIGCSVFLLSACSMNDHSSHDDENMSNHNHMDDSEAKVGDRVFFEFDSSSINAEAAETLKKQAAFMSQNADLQFVIEGHCDERGTREYNLALGERRANSAKQFLVGLGVDANKLTIVSYGKERPAVIGSNDWAWSQNRRSVTVSR